MTNPFLQAALAYAARGWHVVPLRPREKLPLLPGWTAVAAEHGANPEHINAWWTRQPDANLGILTGHASGVIVVDVDPRNGGAFDHPTAPFVRTGSGGYHYFFAHPGGETRVYSKTGKNGIGPGLELKADGGHQVVAAPSLHPLSGQAYAWVREGDLPPPPAEILALAGTYSARDVEPAIGRGGEDDFPLADLGAVVAGCGWLRACRDDAASVSEPEWYASLSVLANCEGGEAAAHEWSSGHPGYSHAETAMKLDRAASASGPAKCSRVAREGWGGGACASCPHLANDASPYSLGTPSALAMAATGSLLPEVAFADAPQPPAAVETGPATTAPAAGVECNLSKKTPLMTARRFLADKFPGGTLRHFMGEYYQHTGTHFQVYPEDWITSDLYRYCEQHFMPNSADVSQVIHALRGCAETRAPKLPAFDPRQPADPKGANVIAFANGLFDIENGSIMTHTPRWLATTSLPFAYDPSATCPQWDAFLASLWALCPDGDAEDAISALQLWFGYALTSDTRQQKFAVLIGEPRSGKSTIGRVLRALLGEDAVAAPRLANLAKDFGLASLAGKQHAVLYDAHCPMRGGESTAVLEILKSIVGEDPVEINRKYRESVTSQLPVRLTMIANEMPIFQDGSGSLVHRMLTWRFTRSFAGNEDRDLEAKLMAELPGICNWALAGLRELRRTGKLRQARVGESLLSEAREMNSSPFAFFKACFEVAPGERLGRKVVETTYLRYADKMGWQNKNVNTFMKRLRDASIPGLDWSHWERGMALINVRMRGDEAEESFPASITDPVVVLGDEP